MSKYALKKERSTRVEVEFASFFGQVTLEGTTGKEYLRRGRAPQADTRPPAGVEQTLRIFTGKVSPDALPGSALICTWRGPAADGEPHGREYVRVVPMSNVKCFEPVRDAQ